MRKGVILFALSVVAASLLTVFTPTGRAIADGWVNGFLRDTTGYLDVNCKVGCSATTPWGPGVNEAGTQQFIPSCSHSAKISTATAGENQLVALASGKTIYVCHFDFIANGTMTVSLDSGTGTSCGTGTTQQTGPYNVTANVGISAGTGTGAILFPPPSNALCINLSAANQVSGLLTYAQY